MLQEYPIAPEKIRVLPLGANIDFVPTRQQIMQAINGRDFGEIRLLFIGVDWVSPGTTEPDPAGAGAVVEALKQRHMLVGVSGQFNNVVKIRPPLVLEREHADLFLAALAEAANDRAESR